MNKLGSVTMSPAAVTIGAATLSRSRLRFAQNAATLTVSTSTMIDERIAPTTEITMKSAIVIDCFSPNSDDMALASTASTAEMENDERIAPATFWPNSVCDPA